MQSRSKSRSKASAASKLSKTGTLLQHLSSRRDASKGSIPLKSAPARNDVTLKLVAEINKYNKRARQPAKTNETATRMAEPAHDL